MGGFEYSTVVAVYRCTKITVEPATALQVSSKDASGGTCTTSTLEGSIRLENMWVSWKSRGGGKNVTTFGLSISNSHPVNRQDSIRNHVKP